MIKKTNEEIFYDEMSGHLKLTKKSIMTIICTQSGGGKSLCAEGMVESYYKSNKTIIVSLNDPKRNFETAFIGFPATEEYHINELKTQGRKPEGLPIRLWHPFSFDIPKHKLPKINFFTIPFSTIDRELLSFLFETSNDTDEIKQILNSLRDLKPSQGFLEAIYKISSDLKDEEERVGTRKIAKPKPPFYTTKVMSGTIANVADIQSAMTPFLIDYFIAPENSPINFNVEDIIRDQEHIHVFSFKWIKDDKVALFSMMCFLKAILSASDRIKNQMVFLIEETPTLFPNKPDGFRKYITVFTSKILKLLRASAMMIIGTTQNLGDIDEKILDAFPKKFLGKIMSFTDTFALSKELKISRDSLELLKDVKKGRFYDLNELATNEATRPTVMKLSTGAHAEEGMKFLAVYEKYHEMNPERYPMQDYRDLIKQMKVLLEKEQSEIEKKAEKDYQGKQKQIEDYLNIKAKKEEEKNQTEQQKIELRKKADEIKLVLMKQVYELKSEYQRLGNWGKGKEWDWSKLALKVFGSKDHKKAQRYFLEYETKYASKDANEEIHKELGNQP